jgi:hypothetical protein
MGTVNGRLSLCFGIGMVQSFTRLLDQKGVGVIYLLIEKGKNKSINRIA